MRLASVGVLHLWRLTHEMSWADKFNLEGLFLLWRVSLWALQLSLAIIKVPVPVLFTNLKDTEWERWRGLCWGFVLACVSQGSAERKLKWWLYKRTNGLQFLPAVPWAVNSRTDSVWPACYTSYPLFVQNKPMNSMCTLNWEDGVS